ncbi:TrlF family AAA-like ATPase [Pseudanabaena sp. BC1403]|uniref:TrlF family AAA-like ATPase n=1 Tax=Pseudanabaena sp. BC1403 TaxID=2043171 RepID=UPI000CD9DC74|nr:hypothetical protein [Pseudanabaena sp. BC1403]
MGFSKGSEWRKWDLHIHTPASFHWEGGKRFREMTDEEKNAELTNLVKRINESDVEVFGIMDYWSFDGYLELKQFLEQNPDVKCNKTILPGMELRIEAPVSFRMNIHALLSNNLSPQQLSDFKSKLMLRIGERERSLSDEALIEFAKSLDSSKAAEQGFCEEDLCDEVKLLKLGSKTAKVTQSCLQEAQKCLSEDLCLIILPHDTSDGFAKLDWKKHSSDANFFMQLADMFEARNDEHISLFLGERNTQNAHFIDIFLRALGGKPKPVVSGSDAHKVSKYGEYPSDKITWIKADPTFEGLRYTIYDPYERVRIGKNNPISEFPKPYFSQIKIQSAQIFPKLLNKKISFTDTKLELNSGLIAIIGGRGTGKSLLLDAIAKTFNKKKSKDRTDEISMQGGFSVTYAKNTGETEEFQIGGESEIIYLHVHQREVQDIVKDPEFLSDAILNMLGISLVGESLLGKEEDIDDILRQIKECKAWLYKHPRDDSQAIIDRRTQLISTITTESNRQLIESYANNISSTKANEKHTNRLTRLKTKLDSLAIEINSEIRSVNDEFTGFSIPIVDFSSQVSSIQEAVSSLTEMTANLKLSNIRVQESLEQEKIEGDPITLLQKVEEYRSEIEKEKETIHQIDTKCGELQSLSERRNTFVNQLDIRFNKLVTHVKDKWVEKSEGRSEWVDQQKKLIKDLLQPISIHGEIYFDESKFYEHVKSCLNLTKFRARQDSSPLDRIKSMIPVNSYEAYKLLISNQPVIWFNAQSPSTLDDFLEQDDYFNQDGIDRLLTLLFSESERQKYLKVLARIKYDDKSPEELSIGQRGTLYLCLKLATESFFDPIIIDQPEDDLDNDFIMKRLVPIFTTIKKYRQIIIATHNANLVVNADAEQVIVADNKSENLSYFSGSLESPKIRERICDVLEGGKEAFRKREQKYGFK